MLSFPVLLLPQRGGCGSGWKKERRQPQWQQRTEEGWASALRRGGRQRPRATMHLGFFRRLPASGLPARPVLCACAAPSSSATGLGFRLLRQGSSVSVCLDDVSAVPQSLPGVLARRAGAVRAAIFEWSRWLALGLGQPISCCASSLRGWVT